MAISDKKMDMAEKMYTQNSRGGKGASPKYKEGSKSLGELSMKYTQNGKGTTKGSGQGYAQADSKGSFEAKYNQADKEGAMTGKYKMAA